MDKKLGGDLEKAALALMDTPLEYDLKQLKHAMKVLHSLRNLVGTDKFRDWERMRPS